MKLLIFEYATAAGIDDPEIFIEGRSMLEALLDDFREFEIEFLLSERFSDIELEAPCKPTIINTPLEDWLSENLKKFDACLFIAAEEDMELYHLSRLVEDAGVMLVGSNPEAVRICSNKRLTYRALGGRVPLPRTFEPHELKGNLDFKAVVKPVDGVACQGITVIEAGEGIKIPADNSIIQEFIDGEAVSVTLLSDGTRAIPLALNSQDIEWNEGSPQYNGGKTPIKHQMLNEAFKVARTAVESINGLRGYVGVDMILADKPYVLEINSRITTPYVGLRAISDVNLGVAVLKAVNGDLPSSIKFDGEVSFRKGTSGMIIDVIKA